MEVYYFTNLDEAKAYLPRSHSAAVIPPPAVGSRVRLPLGVGGSTFDLDVVSVIYDFASAGPYVRVELHIPSGSGMSIREWTEWIKGRAAKGGAL